MATPYLVDHPPTRSQYRAKRREAPSGVIVVHTFEAPIDRSADWGARFIRGRSTPGSYHLLGDRTQAVVHLVPFESEAYHDGTGSNRHSIGISAMMYARLWPSLGDTDRSALIEVYAKMAHQAATWLADTHNIRVPARQITRAASERREPGFIGHGDRDPGRRSDPGPEFPWVAFLTRYSELTTTKEEPVTHPNAASGHRINDLMMEIDHLSIQYRGRGLKADERDVWLADLVKRIYTDGEADLSGVLRWWHWMLSKGE